MASTQQPPLEKIHAGWTYQFMYKNWKGRTSLRTVVLEDDPFSFGKTAFHGDEAQLFLSGICQDKHARRSFVVKDIDWNTFVEVV